MTTNCERESGDITDTPAFRGWFGDSKVVDTHGNPLVVYHSTNADFDQFACTEHAHMGHHFGTLAQATRIGGKRVLPVYLAIARPLATIDAGDWSNPYRVWEVVNRKCGGALDALMLRMIGAAARQERLGCIMKALTALGYDGIVYRNRIEGRGESWIAFAAEQIKSVDNSGGFDPADPRIMFSQPVDQGQDDGEPETYSPAPGRSRRMGW